MKRRQQFQVSFLIYMFYKVISNNRSRTYVKQNHRFRSSPNNQKDKSNDPQYALVCLEFRCNPRRHVSLSRISLANPSKLGADQKHEPKKETRKKPSNMSKVVHMWQNSHCQVDSYDDHKGKKCCKLKIHRFWP